MQSITAWQIDNPQFVVKATDAGQSFWSSPREFVGVGRHFSEVGSQLGPNENKDFVYRVWVGGTLRYEPPAR
jgi:hypothetical protein